ncbi:hypothetical protein TSUD_141270 [Trifolium subterraneum]|uniref:Uncharacterized protein n=1 Tax=Trifolium subterraneum TaxID=3900 RepID=A0A2Z6PJN0_TRISU|nr:hypothetical protein TSUD_141270 [Trifolium subterraneum]
MPKKIQGTKRPGNGKTGFWKRKLATILLGRGESRITGRRCELMIPLKWRELYDRVFQYASSKSAKFLALLIIIPWAIDFLVHDYVFMPFLDSFILLCKIASSHVHKHLPGTWKIMASGLPCPLI